MGQFWMTALRAVGGGSSQLRGAGKGYGTKGIALGILAGIKLLTTPTASGAQGIPQGFSQDGALALAVESQGREILAVDPGTPALCNRDLAPTLNSILGRRHFAGATWGIQVEPLGDRAPLFTHNPDQALIPASTLKLLTTAAALRIFGDRAPQELPQLQPTIEVVNRNSNNWAADTLLRRIGGQQAVRQSLLAMGIEPNSFVQVDGSGLSRNNRLRASTLVTLLQTMAGERSLPHGQQFYQTLPVGGINGTLRTRFRNPPLVGRVRAKTGTLQGVRALAGYVDNPAYGEVVFSILINQPGQSGSLMVNTIDEIVTHLAQVSPCF